MTNCPVCIESIAYFLGLIIGIAIGLAYPKKEKAEAVKQEDVKK